MDSYVSPRTRPSLIGRSIDSAGAQNEACECMSADWSAPRSFEPTSTLRTGPLLPSGFEVSDRKAVTSDEKQRLPNKLSTPKKPVLFYPIFFANKPQRFRVTGPLIYILTTVVIAFVTCFILIAFAAVEMWPFQKTDGRHTNIGATTQEALKP